MNETLAKNFQVTVEPEYMAEESDPEQSLYVFTYSIQIHNSGQCPARLLRRHWIITDGEGDIKEVKGLGVVGKQPLIKSNSTYAYTSGAVLNTELGYMEGSYTMRSQEGKEFQIEIPRFRLTTPFLLH